MSQIFVSASQKDEFEALAIRAWLNECGWSEIFLDLAPERTVHSWEQALRENASRCESVLCLVSRNWLDSEWCRREYRFARKIDKPVVLALIEKLSTDELPAFARSAHRIAPIASDDEKRIFPVVRPGAQEERRVAFSSAGLERIRSGLTHVGLDPRLFSWPPENEADRAPYRGFAPLEAADAGVFFGRDESLIEALDAFRALRQSSSPRLFVLLGASGVGKSSFLRAGLWPRLARDDASFLPLPVIRPGLAAVGGASGFVAALAEAAESSRLDVSRAQIREAIAGGAEALRPLLRDLVERAAPRSEGGRPQTLVVAIDQTEELFRAEGDDEGPRLLKLLRDLATRDDPAVIVLFAIDSDWHDALERAKELDGLRRRVMALPPMRRDGWRAMIEGPAERLALSDRKFEIDPRLTQALLDDAEKLDGDALPLLAFAMRQLYCACGEARRVTFADYVKFGGLDGAVEAAVKRAFAAADGDTRIPKDQEPRLSLLRRGVIPWLAHVDPDSRAPRSRIARAKDIPDDARPLVELLVEQKLVDRRVDGETGETMFALAHDVLLRRWKRLRLWLEEEFGKLATLLEVKRAAHEWDAGGRSRSWATHGGARLEEAERLYARRDLTAALDAVDRAYLAACIDKDKAVREAERTQSRTETESQRAQGERVASGARNARRAATISFVALAGALAVAGVAGMQWQSSNTANKEARAQRDRARKALAAAAEAANGLALDLAQKVKDSPETPAPLVVDMLNQAHLTQEKLIAAGAGANIRRGESVVLNQIVDARLALGDAKGALEAARRSAAIMEAIAAADPAVKKWRRDLSVSHEKVGDALKAQGDLAGALKAYRDDLAIAQVLSEADPAALQLKWDIAVSREKIGDVQLAQGDLSSAFASYREAIAIREAVSAAEPVNAGWRRDLAVGHERMGATQARQGDIRGAIASFERAAAIYGDLVRAHPDDARSLLFSVVPRWRLAELDAARAREHLEAALGILEPLAAADRLDAKRRGWLTQLKAQLATLERPAPAPQPSAAEPAKRRE